MTTEFVVTLYRGNRVIQRNRFKDQDRADDCFDKLEAKYGHLDDYYVEFK